MITQFVKRESAIEQKKDHWFLAIIGLDRRSTSIPKIHKIMLIYWALMGCIRKETQG